MKTALKTLACMGSLASQLAMGQIIGLPPTPADVPSVAQIGGSSAYVPMKHGACESGQVDCLDHVLANPNGNLDMNFKVSMTCSEGDVEFLRIRAQGGPSRTVVRRGLRDSVSRTVSLKPFKASEFEDLCQGLLGGAWPIPGSHHNGVAEAQKTITKRIYVDGRCSDWANNRTRSTLAAVTVTCRDVDFFYPVP